MSTKRSDIRRAVENAAISLAWAEQHAALPLDIEAIDEARTAVDRALDVMRSTRDKQHA